VSKDARGAVLSVFRARRRLRYPTRRDDTWGLGRTGLATAPALRVERAAGSLADAM